LDPLARWSRSAGVLAAAAATPYSRGGRARGREAPARLRSSPHARLEAVASPRSCRRVRGLRVAAPAPPAPAPNEGIAPARASARTPRSVSGRGATLRAGRGALAATPQVPHARAAAGGRDSFEACVDRGPGAE